MKKREVFRLYASKEQEERVARGECPICGKPKTEWTRRKDWTCCSKECSDKFHSDENPRHWNQVRMRAFKRDNFTCVKCGYKPKVTRSEYNYSKQAWDEFEITLENEEYPGQYAWKAAEYFVGDHITPIAVGGDEWDVNNIQTLCQKCNKAKTAADAKIIGFARKRAKHGSLKEVLALE